MPTTWPDHYKAIPRVQFSSTEQLIHIMKARAQSGEPIIIEGSNLVSVAAWADPMHLARLLQETPVTVKKSPGAKFRYYDTKKNTGNFDFKTSVVASQQTYGQFSEESSRIMLDAAPERMYLQETLSGHAEMAEEFVSWRWDLLIQVSSACQWGLPDSNELFVGMRDAETPLHFDERENLFFQVRGQKELVVFPFQDYARLYPFPTTHPCDRQSMVGDPRNADLKAFPKFAACVGHYATLTAGDLVYLPYGWWHWLRNLDHMSVSVSFWSTTPRTVLTDGVPELFSEHMLTRVRRNLESMLAQTNGGPTKHNITMLAIRDAILRGDETDPVLQHVRPLLTAVKIAPAQQDAFLLEMIEGRFGVDWNSHV